VYIKVEVLAGAREESVRETGPDYFFISVREKAEQNSANRRVLELIRGKFGGQGTLVKIVSGHRSPRKIFSVEKKNPPERAGFE